jgi:hypothetical protein
MGNGALACDNLLDAVLAMSDVLSALAVHPIKADPTY